jgi:pyruvate dehydrogenase E2 component (dihydrolipoamide acetyltransferase)
VISEVVMPQMGADMTEGTLLRWLKHEGDPVERGEIIAEIETDKANVEIEAFGGGTFRKVLAEEGDIVRVGEVIAVIGDASDDISRYAGGARPTAAQTAAPAAAAAAAVPVAPPSPAEAAKIATTAPAPSGGNGRLRASPLARRLARERGIDLATVRGTGPDGRILKSDLERTQRSEPVPAPPAERRAPPVAASVTPQPRATTPQAVQPMSRMRQAIARRMSQSKREAPHYYLLVDIDMTESLAFRREANGALGEDAARISINDLIVKACALALRTHPSFNCTMEGEQVVAHDEQNVCIAIALDDGLIAPALIDVAASSLAEIARQSKDLVARAKGGSLRPEELSAGTFSITNLGAYGIETLIGIIQPPQTAILGVGSVMEQPAVRDGSVVARQMMKVALSADHRVTDGAQGAQFLTEIKRLVEHPLRLVL